mgnify:CR=1 FL=1
MIRFAQDQDWPAVYEIYKYYVENTDFNLDWTPLSFQEFAARQKEIQKDYPYLVAEVNGEVIGYACAHKAFAKASYQYDADLTIYFRQGRHYGQADAIMDRLEEILYRQNIHWLIGCITKCNAKSIAFHRRRGFEFNGELPHAGLKSGKFVSVVWYGKVIKPEKEFEGRDLKFIPIGELND